jgi:hypothetical protein
MKLQNKKARVPIAALGVAALISGAGALTSPAFAVTALTLNSGGTSPVVANVGYVTTAEANAAYALKVTGADEAVSLGLVSAPTGGTLNYDRETANAAADTSFLPLAMPAGAATDEVQTVTITGTPTGGTFTLGFGSVLTTALAYNATATTVDTALEVVVGAGNVVVTGGPGPGTAYTVTFAGTLAGRNVTALTASGASLTGGTSPAVAVTTPTPGVSAVAKNEVQAYTVTGTPTGGTYTLSYGGVATAGIAYNASAATVDTALELVVGTGNVVVTGGPSATAQLTVTFGGDLASRDVSALTASAASLTGGTPVIGVGTIAAGASGPAVSLGSITSTEYVYVTGDVPGTYTFRLFQDSNTNLQLDADDERSTALITMTVYDAGGPGTTVVTSDDVAPVLAATTPVTLGEVVTAGITYSKPLSLTDARGSLVSTGLAARLAALTFVDITGTATDDGLTLTGVTDASNQVASYSTTTGLITRAIGTPSEAGSIAIRGDLKIVGAADNVSYGSKTVVVATNGASALSALAVTAVTGSIKSSAGVAKIKPATTTATYSTTVTDATTTTDDVVTFTLTPGTNSPVLTSTGTLVSGTTGVMVYSTTADADGLATITVTSSVTTDGTTYTVAAASNGHSATGVTTTFETPAGSTFESTNTAVELNPTAPATGVGSVVIKGKVIDQYGVGGPTTASAAVTINIDVNNSSYGSADVTGTAAAASDGTFSYTYVPTVAPVAGQSDFIQFTSAGVTTPLATTSIKWSSSSTIASITITAPLTGATAVTLQDNTAPDATQVNGGTPAFGNTTGLVAGTVYDSTSTALAFKAVTLSGSAGVYFATSATPDATHLLTSTLDVVSSSTGTLTGAYVFFTKSGTATVTATAGTVHTTSTVTTSAPAAGQKYCITVEDAAGEPGATLIVTGTVTDLFGNGVPAYDPTLSTGSSTVGTLGDTTPTTNSAGIFSTTFLSGSNQSGDVPLTATLTGLTANPTPVAAWLTAGITVPTGDFEDDSTISVTETKLTLTSTAKLMGGGTAHVSGTFMPGTGVDIWSKASGAASYTLLDSVVTDDAGAYAASYSLKKTTSFLAKSAGLSSAVDTTVVYSTVKLTGKSYSHNRATLMANGSPSAKGTLTFYRSVVGKDPVLGTMMSNSSGNGTKTVKLPKGTRSVYAKFKAPGTTTGKSTIIKIKVK